MRGWIEVQNRFQRNSKKWKKIAKKSAKIFPKPSPKPTQIDRKSIQKASWRPSGAQALQKLDFERPKNSQKSRKSVEKRPKTVPNPSQMKPKTLPNPIFEWIFGLYFLTQISHRFFLDFLLIFGRFLRARTLKNSNFPWEKYNFLQNRHFQEKWEKSVKNPPQILPKSTPNPPKTSKNQ